MWTAICLTCFSFDWLTYIFYKWIVTSFRQNYLAYRVFCFNNTISSKLWIVNILYFLNMSVFIHLIAASGTWFWHSTVSFEGLLNQESKKKKILWCSEKKMCPPYHKQGQIMTLVMNCKQWEASSLMGEQQGRPVMWREMRWESKMKPDG